MWTVRMDEFGDGVFFGCKRKQEDQGFHTTTIMSIELDIHSPLSRLSSLHICPS